MNKVLLPSSHHQRYVWRSQLATLQNRRMQRTMMLLAEQVPLLSTNNDTIDHKYNHTYIWCLFNQCNYLELVQARLDRLLGVLP